MRISDWSSDVCSSDLPVISAFTALDVVQIAYDETEKRSFIVYNRVALALTVGAILFLLLSLGAIVVLPIVLAFIGFGETGETELNLLRWPILAVLVMVELAAL